MTQGSPPYNTVAWFQVSTDDPATTKAFYGDLFDWRFSSQPGLGASYETVSYVGAERPAGGLTNSADGYPRGAIFSVLVEDVAAVCARAESQGGKILVPPSTAANGLVFAELTDPVGNHFGVFTPAA